MNIYISAAPPIYMSYTPTDDLLEKSGDGGLKPAQASSSLSKMNTHGHV